MASVPQFVDMVTVVGSLLVIGNQLDRQIRPSTKSMLVDLLDATFPPYAIDWYREINDVFQSVFEYVYGYRDRPREHITWVAIITTYWALVVIRGLLWVFGIEPPATPSLLAASFALSLGVIMGVASFFVSRDLHDALAAINHHLPTLRDQRIEFVLRVAIGLGAVAFEAVFIAYSAVSPTIPLWVAMVVEIPVIVVVFVSFYETYPDSKYPIVPRSGQKYAFGAVILILAAGAVLTPVVVMLVTSSTLSGGVFLTFLLAPLILLPSLYLFLKIPDDWISVNPITAMVSSLFFVTVVGILKFDAAMTFYQAISVSGPLILTFLAFNMFADVVSLSETRWVLIKSQRASAVKLFGLLLADLALSAVIYTILPIIVGQSLTEFWQGIQFGGPKPWIGVLFWSTFSTSAIFYLFLAAVSIAWIVKPLGRYSVRLADAFQFEENPMFVIFLIISVLISLSYSMAGFLG